MDGDDWVIDTNVFASACDADSEAYLDALGFLDRIRTSHRIALDYAHQNRIMSEYQRTVGGQKYFQRWWREMLRKRKVVQRDGRLPNRHRRHLVDNLRFHDDDLPFVAVASRGDSKLLATEDSDYTAQVREYLRSALGVDVLSAAEALGRAAG